MKDPEFCVFVDRLHEKLVGSREVNVPLGCANGEWVITSSNTPNETTTPAPKKTEEPEEQKQSKTNERIVTVAIGDTPHLGGEVIGTKVKRVEPGSPLYDAGIVAGCIITSINGTLVTNKRDINKAVKDAVSSGIAAISVVFPSHTNSHTGRGRKSVRNILDTDIPVEKESAVFQRTTDHRTLERMHKEARRDKLPTTTVTHVAAEPSKGKGSIQRAKNKSPETPAKQPEKKKRRTDKIEVKNVEKLGELNIDDHYDDDALLDDCFSDKVSVVDSITVEHNLDGLKRAAVLKLVESVGEEHHHEIGDLFTTQPETFLGMNNIQINSFIKVYAMHKRLRTAIKNIFSHLFLDKVTEPLLRRLLRLDTPREVCKLLDATSENVVKKQTLESMLYLYVQNPSWQGVIKHVYPELFKSGKLDEAAMKLAKVAVQKD
eukprot:TRINITY_DN4164_c0_g1_i1.p1 TRINITY_DN4164_c0_g1~~TRINITY_DN4164_c0_g1_i1.p1  ORF type:complete len:432 (+),score=74.23 TRINITY_DN4164_c0_g1_i1:66-1361(+)